MPDRGMDMVSVAYASLSVHTVQGKWIQLSPKLIEISHSGSLTYVDPEVKRSRDKVTVLLSANYVLVYLMAGRA